MLGSCKGALSQVQQTVPWWHATSATMEAWLLADPGLPPRSTMVVTLGSKNVIPAAFSARLR